MKSNNLFRKHPTAKSEHEFNNKAEGKSPNRLDHQNQDHRDRLAKFHNLVPDKSLLMRLWSLIKKILIVNMKIDKKSKNLIK